MKRHPWILILFIALAFLVESRWQLFGVGLNITVLFVYRAGLKYGPVNGALTGAGIGIVADSLGGGMLGPYMLSGSTVGILSANLRGGLFMWSPLLGFIAVAAFTMMDGYIAHACASVFGFETVSTASVSRTLLWQSAMNAWAGLLLRPEDGQH